MIQNEFIQIIKHLFEIYSNLTFVVNAKRQYTFGEIYQKSLQVSSYLNSKSGRKLNIALIANNSVEWIICFFGIIFSKHHLVLFSPNLSIEKVRHVIMDAKVDILFTDINDYFELPSVHYMTGNLNMNVFICGLDIEDTSEGIFVYTPNKLKPVWLSFKHALLTKLSEVSNHNLFIEHTDYYQSNKIEFTYNYIICILLPLSRGCRIYFGSPVNTFDGTIITTGYEFEKTYKSYIEKPTSFLDNILRANKWLYFIRKKIVKHRMNMLFPGLHKLVILNSYVSLDIEEVLKDIKYPIVFTYGKVEDCGINISTCFITHNIEERTIKSFMFVKDCMMIPVDMSGSWARPSFLRYNLIISINWDEVDYYELTKEEVELTLHNNLRKLSYGKEISVRIIPGDFKRDLYGRPQSPMYT